MSWKIKADVLQALDDWKAGKPVKSLELGHVQRMKEHREQHAAKTIDFSVRLSNDNERAHAYCFQIIERISGMIQPPADHATFLSWCVDVAWRSQFQKEFGELTPEEIDGAESLAWKVLHVGWARAIAGHDPSRYVEVTNPAAVAAT